MATNRTAGGGRSSTSKREPLPLTDTEKGSFADRPYGLTSRELEVLSLACGGLSNSEIARRCNVSVGVIKVHLHHAYGKLSVQGRVQAIPIVEHLDAIQKIRIGNSGRWVSPLDWLIPHMTHERREAKDVLFRIGDPGNRLYYVQTGYVDLPEIGARVGKGELLGEIGIFAREHRRTSSAVCASNVDLFVITSERAKLLCVEHPLFAVRLIELIADRLTAERKSSVPSQ